MFVQKTARYIENNVIFARNNSVVKFTIANTMKTIDYIAAEWTALHMATRRSLT